MTLRRHDTASRTVRPFADVDLLRRWPERGGTGVRHVRKVTDIVNLAEAGRGGSGRPLAAGTAVEDTPDGPLWTVKG